MLTPRGTLAVGKRRRSHEGRDAQFASQTVELLHRLGRQGGRPRLAVSSFVNPHDIALWGAITLRMGKWKLRAQLDGSKVPEDLFDSRYAATSRGRSP